MKFLTYLFFIYLMALTSLPSVRVVKMLVSSNAENSCHNTTANGCEKSKIIMSFNFSPTQYVAEISLKEIIIIPDFYIEKEKSNYEKFFIPKHQASIWHPPKIINLV